MAMNDISKDSIILFAKSNFNVVEIEISGEIIIILELPSFENLKLSLDKLLEE